MNAVHKLCSTKVNSDKIPGQIYSWSAVLSSVILYIVHVYTYIITTAYFIVSMHACHNLRLLLKTLFSNYGIIYHVANDWNDVLAFLLW